MIKPKQLKIGLVWFLNGGSLYICTQKKGILVETSRILFIDNKSVTCIHFSSVVM